ncbi:scavenger receptor cysteine-rich type 1 protein M130-like [Cetorhinus maximus]
MADWELSYVESLPGFRKVFEGEPGICVQHSVKAQFPAQDPSAGKMLRSFLTLTALQLLKCRTGSSQADPSEAVKLRLANGGSRCAGRLEIHYRGQWGTVYGNSWDLQDAAVVCRELGCGTADSAPGRAHFGEGSGPIVTQNVQCSGNEAALRDCKSYSWGHYSWPHDNDASAICSEFDCPVATVPWV